MNSQNNITNKSKRYGEKIWIKLDFNIIVLTLISAALNFFKLSLISLALDFTTTSLWYVDKIHMFWSNWILRDCAFAQPIGAGQLKHGGKLCFSVCILLKSWNRPWNRDFSRFYLISTWFHPFFIFFKRFNMQIMLWLVKSNNFTSQNAILTTLSSLQNKKDQWS